MPKIKNICILMFFLFFMNYKSYGIDITLPNTEVTLYLVYVASARNHIEAGGTGQLNQPNINTFLLNNINSINQFFKNTGVNITLKLLFSESTTLPTTTNITKDIYQFVKDTPYSTTEAKKEYTRIRGKRDEIAADIVGLITYNDWNLDIWAQGVAGGLPSVDGKKTLDGERAYFIVDVGRFNQYNIDLFATVMAHEIGHILGLGHDKETALNELATRNIPLSEQSISSIGHGYVIKDGTERVAQTVMAYEDQNPVDYQQLLNQSIPFFSNASKTLQDVFDSPFGKALGNGKMYLKLGISSGDRDNYYADEVNVLNDNASTYAQFRVDKKLTIIKNSCAGKLEKAIIPDVTNLCGSDGSLCGDCNDMDLAIKGIYTNDYSFLQTRIPDFSPDFVAMSGMGSLNSTDRPYGVFVENGQTRLYEYAIKLGDVPTEGNYKLQIDYIVSNLTRDLKTLYNEQGAYFNADIYVDDNFYGPAVKADYNSVKTTSIDARTSNVSSISSNVWLKTTSKKLSIIITSGQLNTFSTNSNMAIVVIKNFDLSPAVNDVSTENDQYGTGDNHNTSSVNGTNGNGLSVFINGNTVTLPPIRGGNNPLFNHFAPYKSCEMCAMRNWPDVNNGNFIRVKINWGDGTESDWVQYDYIPFVHTYKETGTYQITTYSQEKGNVWGFLSGWGETSPPSDPYPITINPPPKTDEPASISIPRRTVALSEQNKRFFPETANLRFKEFATCNATGTISPISKTATGKIKIDWGDGIIDQTTIHLDNFPSTWNHYVHIYQMPGRYQIKVFYETKDIIKITSSSGQPTVTCYNFEQQTVNDIEIAPFQTALAPLTLVRIPGKNLMMTPTEITVQDYCSVTDRSPSNVYFSSESHYNYPISEITYYDAIVYCNLRSLGEGLIPVYSYDPPKESDYSSDSPYVKSHWNNAWGARRRLSTLRNLTVNCNNNGYRLPTKDEWEYAYLAGVSASANNGYYWTSGDIGEYAWYAANSVYANSINYSHPVGLKKANNWGLYDMAGNVAEWTMNDQYSPDNSNGGSYNSTQAFLTYHNSNTYPANYDYRTVGFRVVRKSPVDMSPILNLLLD